MKLKLMIRLYRLLLRLYPDRFYRQYATEMEEVFTQAVIEASQKGPAALRAICLRELWDFPSALLQAYTQEQQSQIKLIERKTNWEGPLSLKELLTALLAFLLPVALIVLNFFLPATQPISITLITTFVILTFLAGLLKGLPRWSLPYLGYVLSIAGYLMLSNWLVDQITPLMRKNLPDFPLDARLQPIQELFWAGFTWTGLLVLTLVLLGCVCLLRRFRPFYQRIQQDWTLVPFILFAESVLMLIILLNQHQYQAPYMAASLFVLGGGAWIYLRSPIYWQRFLALISTLSLAICQAGIGKWASVLKTIWNQGAQGRLLDSTPWQDLWSLSIHWGWMMFALLITALLHRILFPGPNPFPNTGKTPQLLQKP